MDKAQVTGSCEDKTEEMDDNSLVSLRLTRAERRLESVREIGRALSSTLDRDQLLDMIMHKTTEIMEADRSTLFLVDEEGGEIWSKVAQGTGKQIIRMPLGKGLSGWVAQTGETVNLHDAYHDERFNPEVDRITGYTTQSMLVMPLKNHRGQNIGVIQVLNKRCGDAFDRDDELLLEAISAQAAISLENAGLYGSLLEKNLELRKTSEQLTQRTYELDILYDIEKEMNQAVELEEMIANILGRTISLLSCKAGSVALVDEEDQRLYFRSATGEKAEQVQQISLPKGEGFVGWAALHGQPVLSNQPEEDQRFRFDIAKQLEFPDQSALCVPLSVDDRVIGAVELLNKTRPSGFTQDDLKILTLIAAQIARAVEIGQQRAEHVKQERLATIGQMLSGVLHDFKTPMTIISGYVQLLSSQDDPEQRKLFAEAVIKQIDRLNKMTREVLAFARGESSLLIRKVLLNKFFNDIKQNLEEDFAGTGIELRLELGYRGPAWFDEIKIQRLIYNLARNAREAMAERSQGIFEINTELQDESLLFRFRDNGSGIPEEIHSRIFETFVSRKKNGTGLGLAIVKKIVDEHQGAISFESHPEEGTIFTVRIPLRKEEDLAA